jgi:hypothetical protein
VFRDACLPYVASWSCRCQLLRTTPVHKLKTEVIQRMLMRRRLSTRGERDDVVDRLKAALVVEADQQRRKEREVGRGSGAGRARGASDANAGAGAGGTVSAGDWVLLMV